MARISVLDQLLAVQSKIRELRREMEALQQQSTQLQERLYKQLIKNYGEQKTYFVNGHKVTVVEYEREVLPAKALKELKKTELWKVLEPHVVRSKVWFLKIT